MNGWLNDIDVRSEPAGVGGQPQARGSRCRPGQATACCDAVVEQWLKGSALWHRNLVGLRRHRRVAVQVMQQPDQRIARASPHSRCRAIWLREATACMTGQPEAGRRQMDRAASLVGRPFGHSRH